MQVIGLTDTIMCDNQIYKIYKDQSNSKTQKSDGSKVQTDVLMV